MIGSVYDWFSLWLVQSELSLPVSSKVARHSLFEMFVNGRVCLFVSARRVYLLDVFNSGRVYLLQDVSVYYRTFYRMCLFTTGRACLFVTGRVCLLPQELFTSSKGVRSVIEYSQSVCDSASVSWCAHSHSARLVVVRLMDHTGLHDHKHLGDSCCQWHQAAVLVSRCAVHVLFGFC